MQVKIKAGLPDPDKSQENGLEPALDRILRGRKGNFAAVVLLHCSTVEEATADGSKVANMQIIGIELMEGVDELLAMDLIQLYRNNRTGQHEIRHNAAEARTRREELMGAADKAPDLPTRSLFAGDLDREPGF